MKLLPLLLFALSLASCAAHNDHRIRVDPAYELDVMLGEALESLEQNGGQAFGLPTSFEVEVEDLGVTWLDDAAPADAPPLDLQDRLEDMVRQSLELSGLPEEEGLELRVRWDVDLSDPEVAWFQLHCRLRYRGDRVATGVSRLAKRERLFCHGCHDTWFGPGKPLARRNVAAQQMIFLGVGVSRGPLGFRPAAPAYRKR